MVAGFAKDRPWIPEADKASLLTMVERVEEWLQNKTTEQNALALHDVLSFLPV